MSARFKLKPLSEQTIVVTGATSGIGLATARRAAAAGARVFLVARSESDLGKLCEELQAEGARVAYAAVDVADPEALAAAADRCARLFGGIDTWVNNAGVAIYGPIRDTPLEDHKRLFETNYWGAVNGSLAAIDHLKTSGGGALINIGSLLSDAPYPVQGAYSASKHAVKGFTNALRMELIREKAPVSVTLVKPAAVDTPYKDHARNLTGRPMRNPPPVYAAHVVADAILYCASHKVREITVGGGGRLLATLYAAAPGVAEPLFARVIPLLHRDRRGRGRPAEDGLYDPTEDGLYEETEYPMVRQFSALAQARMHPRATAGGVLAIVGLAVIAILLAQRSGPSRYERIRERMNPRRWVEASGVRHWGDRARGRASGLYRRAADAFPGEELERGARGAGRFAREHAKEGGALIALATIAAAVAAAAVQSSQQAPAPKKGLSRFF